MHAWAWRKQDTGRRASLDTGWLRQVTFPTQVYTTAHPFPNRYTVFEIISEAGDFMVRSKALQEGLHLNKSIWEVLSVSGGSVLTGKIICRSHLWLSNGKINKYKLEMWGVWESQMPTHTGKLAFSHLLCLVKMGSPCGKKKWEVN